MILSLLMVTTLSTFLPACAPKEEVASVSDSNFISLSEGFTDKKVFDETTAKQALASISLSLGIEDAEKELKVNQVSKIGNDSYYRMQQYYNDIPVYGRSVVLSADSEGTATALTANSIHIPEDVIKQPSASRESIIKSIKKYLQREMGIEDVSDLKVDFKETENLFYYQTRNSDIILIYAIPIGIYEFFVDASTAEVLDVAETIMEDSVETCFNANGTKSFEGYYYDNTKKYVAYNQARGITIYNLLGGDIYEGADGERLESIDSYFGNVVSGDTTEKEHEYEKGVTLMNNMVKIYDYYAVEFSETAYGELIAYYNDGYDNGKNALGGQRYGRGVVSFGTEQGVEQLDTMAHEYTHVVTRSKVDWIDIKPWVQETDEPGAINEAYSDIFGEIIEAYIKKQAPDWKHGNRIMSDPMSKNYPAKVGDKEYERFTNSKGKIVWGMSVGGTTYTDYSHGFSTIISHAAYLMWNGIDGTENQKIDTETLAKLWYRAMHLLQSDATFSQCANAVTIAAQQMYQDDAIHFTVEQLSCVKEAFEEVGITSNIVGASMVANGSTIYAKDATGKKSYDNYKLLIKKVNLSTRSEEVVVEIDVTDENGYTFDLEGGTYFVTATDNAVDGSEYQYSTIIRVFGNQGTKPSNFRYTKQLPKQKIYIYTDFKTKILAENFTIPSEQIITLGELGVIEAQIDPSDAESYDIKWSSSDDNVATVSPTGKAGIITTREKGTTTITATLESGGKTITKSTNLRVASKGRDTVLLLDISGSMAGTPMEEMKQSATNFCKQLLLDEYNNRVGIVFYDDEVDKINLTNDLDMLVSYIDSVDDGGMTNMEAGIATAKEMLDTDGKEDNIKNIVVMADGLPNEGKISDSGAMAGKIYSGYTATSYANAVIDTAREAMQTYNMYSLGFFHSLYDEELDFANELMTKLTNQTDGYHQVAEAENLQFAFGDISEEISDGSKIIINIACPVDVQITYNGETLSSAQNNFNDKTSFGSLQLLGSDQDIKVVSLEPDIDYDVELVGTGEGQMNYSVNYLDEAEEVIDHRDFPSVPITSTTRITSSTDVAAQDMSLNVDENGDGEVDVIWTATAKGVAEITYDSTPEPEEEVVETEPIEEVVENNDDEESWLILLVVLGIIIVCGVILITIIVIGNDSAKRKFVVDEEEQEHKQEKSQSTEPKTDVFQAYVAKLEVLSAHEAPREIVLEDGKTYGIGKTKQYVDILVTSSEKVSRLHCSISYSSKYKKYFVTDCSSNGTFYQNGQRLERGKRVAVEPGTTLMLADENCKIKLK